MPHIDVPITPSVCDLGEVANSKCAVTPNREVQARVLAVISVLCFWEKF